MLTDPKSKMFYPENTVCSGYCPQTLHPRPKKIDPDFVNTFRADDIYICHIGPKSGFFRVPSHFFKKIPAKFNWGTIRPPLLEEGLARTPKMGLKSL